MRNSHSSILFDSISHSTSMENCSSAAATRGLKRKLEHEDQASSSETQPSSPQSNLNMSEKILEQVSLLNSASSSSFIPFDRALLKNAIWILSQLAKNENMVKPIMDGGVVPALVRHLDVPHACINDDIMNDEEVTEGYQYEVATECAFLIDLLAIEREYQQHFIDAGALPRLVDLLNRYRMSTICQPLIDLLRRVAGAITSLAYENNRIKTLVRLVEGIFPLVQLLDFNDIKVQRAAARALRTISFNNDANKNIIVKCNALSHLVLMLQLEDPKIRSEAVGVIGNLVHSSPFIKQQALLVGVLQPVICLLSSSCPDSQREAALLIGQFASGDPDWKVHIAQRGAIPPLIKMLKSQDAELREMSSFALGRLAQDPHNQAGIAYHGGIGPLLKLIESCTLPTQHNAAFAIYGLADNEDVVADIITAGGFQKLTAAIFRNQYTRDCVTKTLVRFQQKLRGRATKRLVHIMRFAEESVQRIVVVALSFFCSHQDLKYIFIDNNGLTLLLDALNSPSLEQKSDASAALDRLATKANSSGSLFVAAPLSPRPQKYLGEEFINNPKLSDVIFLVEGKHFYAHRECLVSSDIFGAMFDGGYRETKAEHIVIPDIKWDVFELMMRFLYTGTADVNLDIAQDLLKVADQYLLDGLKRICEYALAQELTVENVLALHTMSDDFNATALKHSCILFMLNKYHHICFTPWYYPLILSITPDIHALFSTLLGNS